MAVHNTFRICVYYQRKDTKHSPILSHQNCNSQIFDKQENESSAAHGALLPAAIIKPNVFFFCFSLVIQIYIYDSHSLLALLSHCRVNFPPFLSLSPARSAKKKPKNTLIALCCNSCCTLTIHRSRHQYRIVSRPSQTQISVAPIDL